MRHLFIILFFIFFSQSVSAQDNNYSSSSLFGFASETAFSAEIGFGGSPMFSGTLETMFLPRLSAQLGAGFWGYSGGVSYHIYPTVCSPYFTLKAWQNGLGNRYKAIYVGPSFTYRASRLIQAGIGAGYMINKHPNFNPASKYVLTVNMGLYIPMW